MAFLDDSRTLLFTTQTLDTHRPDKVTACSAFCRDPGPIISPVLCCPKRQEGAG